MKAFRKLELSDVMTLFGAAALGFAFMDWFFHEYAFLGVFIGFSVWIGLQWIKK